MRSAVKREARSSGLFSAVDKTVRYLLPQDKVGVAAGNLSVCVQLQFF
jgi:hypothetical protein